jgi:hypothetical protein
LSSGRRVPPWLRHAHLIVPFGVLYASLVLRLLVVNGDAPALGAFLLALLASAFLANFAWGGRSFCHYLCPVGVVERLYTDAGTPARSQRSRCTRCNGCKSACADIDQDRAYRVDLGATKLRAFAYAFPGLVYGFYAYYWLREGHWEAFFGGRWTERAFDRALALGPGLFFAPEVPALVAAPAALAATSLASWFVFGALERAATRRGLDPDRTRHRVVALAAFTAFSTFYRFAGAPLYRQVPGLTEIVAFVAPVVATLVLMKRWQFFPEPERAAERGPRIGAGPRRPIQLPIVMEASR